ncbi:MAG: 4Fe-4S dicluster domain-containing protein [Acidobacteriota bacterium]
MRIRISRDKVWNSFVKKIEELSGQDLLSCYQCGKCSAGCPVVSEMDILPNQIIRYAQMGLEEELLHSKAIWICASCFTCNTRCPKGINIAEVFEAARQILLRKGKDHLKIREISEDDIGEIPPIAIISSMRKLTS